MQGEMQQHENFPPSQKTRERGAFHIAHGPRIRSNAGDVRNYMPSRHFARRLQLEACDAFLRRTDFPLPSLMERESNSPPAVDVMRCAMMLQ
jgi:hypothetical protein